jgi:hypothetical protein
LVHFDPFYIRIHKELGQIWLKNRDRKYGEKTIAIGLKIKIQNFWWQDVLDTGKLM